MRAALAQGCRVLPVVEVGGTPIPTGMSVLLSILHGFQEQNWHSRLIQMCISRVLFCWFVMLTNLQNFA